MNGVSLKKIVKATISTLFLLGLLFPGMALSFPGMKTTGKKSSKAKYHKGKYKLASKKNPYAKPAKAKAKAAPKSKAKAVPVKAKAKAASQNIHTPWVVVNPMSRRPFDTSRMPGGSSSSKGVAKRRGRTNPKPQLMQGAKQFLPDIESFPKQRELNREEKLRYRYLQGQIIATCCYVSTVALHSGQVTKLIRQDLKNRILLGHTNKKIIRAYVSKFGEKVLGVPPHGHMYWIPISAGILFLAIAGFFTWKWRRRYQEETDTEAVSV